MNKIIKLLLVLALFFSYADAGWKWSATKAVGKSGVVYGATKALNSNAGKQAVKSIKEKIHKNSKEYKGDSHVYRIKNKDGTYKIGESSQGKNDKGLSRRAEQQVRKLRKTSGDDSFEASIMKEFSSKKEARDYETKVIERMRSFYGKNKNDKLILVGNKNNR